MLRMFPLFVLMATSLVVLSCQDDVVVRTGEITTRTNPDYLDEFPTYETFSVVTSDQVEPPEDLPEGVDPEQQELFNRRINQLIIDAMTNEPVCLDYIPPDQTSDENQPDLWAANGVAQSEENGWVYQCCGGWWWGYWGWYWDPCAYWCPTEVQYEVGTLFIPVGFPVATGTEPEGVFAGIAQSVIDSQNIDEVESKIRFAIQEIFKDWPDKRECPAQ